MSKAKSNLGTSQNQGNLVLLLVLCLTIVTGGCSPIRSISYDYNRELDFSGLKTYDWIPIPAEMQKTETLMLERIKKAVDSRLKAKGFTIDKDAPDFLVATNFGQVEKLKIYDRGYPYGPYWRGNYYYDGPYYWGGVGSYYYREGTIVLDFIDSDSKQVIWKGEATGVLNTDLTPEKIDRIVDEAVEKILENFPPAITE